MGIYIQITDRCNMKCAHCGFDCKLEGTDMSPANFKAALALAKEHESTITIGGGEPTLHPNLKEFMMESIWELTEVGHELGMTPIHIVTNGSIEDKTLSLARLASTGTIGAALSQDQYHDSSMVSERVRRAFPGHKERVSDTDYRSINKLYRVRAAGRAKEWVEDDHSCFCPDVFVDPHGNVYPCGCKQGKIGHVQDGLILPYGIMSGYCYVNEHEEWKAEIEEEVQA